MSASSKNILCRYHYDPLDRLTGLTPLGHPGTQRFYQNNELVNEIDSEAQLTIVRNGEQPLAQRLSVIGVTETTLLATDQQRSPLTAVTDADLQRMAYTAYGHRTGESGLSSLLGFNGERPEPITGHYLLGQGNRAFNPVLMRFNSPDELSPFGEGGINAYAYCKGDPINRYDPSGHFPIRPRPSTAPLTKAQKLLNASKHKIEALSSTSVAISRPGGSTKPQKYWTELYNAPPRQSMLTAEHLPAASLIPDDADFPVLLRHSLHLDEHILNKGPIQMKVDAELLESHLSTLGRITKLNTSTATRAQIFSALAESDRARLLLKEDIYTRIQLGEEVVNIRTQGNSPPR
ncbi:RHS repeat-associated core domain-containing protein [Pseudomonas sp. NFACC13-1]|uniref:RHS repeat-associated core domain-containing protein n=1 Tax=Pseudomonas sp. NFACC13-1 TaxID=1566245 RepID=UPI00088EA8F9|nr:RHS repeat-associated core domain-containing protein [Pseudomonas sp. NFACC13-1]SDB12048.1 RHS repeat-associated core domain-containing protein [Pseudomonas sp. NFACC13-1]